MGKQTQRRAALSRAKKKVERGKHRKKAAAYEIRATQISAEPTPRPPTVGYWAVAYLDLLGYRRALQAFDVYPLPSNDADRDRLSKKFARAAYFPKRLVDGVNEFMRSVRPAGTPSHLPVDVQATVTAWRRTRIGVSGTGDAVILRLPLYGDDDHFPPIAVDTMLTAACAASLLQLAIGSDDPEDTLPIRGGIDIGAGIHVDDDVYTAALAKAVTLESSAIYPRVLIGDKFIEYLHTYATLESRDPTSRFARAIAQFDQRFIFRDPVDGNLCLDFIGDAYRERTGAASRQLVRDAWTFIEKARAFHADDPKLLCKYEWLSHYFTSRLPGWSL